MTDQPNQVRFARRFTATAPGQPDIHGIQFPDSGHVLADVFPTGLTAFLNVDAVTEGIDGAVIHWAPEADDAHQLAERLRNEAFIGDKSGFTRIYYRAAADFIDPKAADDPLTVLRAVEQNPRYQLVDGCPHCPDGHTPPDHGQAWSAWVAEARDGDGQPMQIIVARSAGAHVAETDAEWVRRRLNDTTDQP